MDDKRLKMLLAARDETPNVLAPNWAGRWSDGGRSLFCAGGPIRAMAQNSIDLAADSAGVAVLDHLHEAKILIMVKGGQRPNADGLLELGRAQKATARDRILAANADFVITINGDAWDNIEGLEPGGEPTAEHLRTLHLRQAYTLEHELVHCHYAVGVKWVAKSKLPQFIEQLGSDYISSDEKNPNDKGKFAVKFVKRRPDADGNVIRPKDVEASEGKLTLSPRCWRMRKHDIQDFGDMMARWGADGITMATLNKRIDADKPLLTADRKLSKSRERGRT